MNTTAILVSALLAAGAGETANFDKGDVGKAPSGWTATQTGTGHAMWVVVADETAPSKPNAWSLASAAKATPFAS